eukprot:15467129-Alexandrium_andersonii.AAC.1
MVACVMYTAFGWACPCSTQTVRSRACNDGKSFVVRIAWAPSVRAGEAFSVSATPSLAETGSKESLCTLPCVRDPLR